jgi:subtilisin family serine protease
MDSAEAEHEHGPAKLTIQVDLIVDAFGEEGIVVKMATRPDGTMDFLYQEGVILVRDAYLRDVAAFLHERQVDGAAERAAPTAGALPGAEGVLPGVSLYSLAGSDFAEVLAALDAIDARFGVGVATPNHILSVTPVFACPATEPEEVLREALPDPGQCDGGGNGVFIYVTDTGLLRDADDHPWLAGVTGQHDPPAGVAASPVPEYTGHGTFVAGVARCMAPVAKIRVTRDFDKAGALSEHDLVKRLGQALGLGPDIINLSAGGTTRKDLPLLSFVAFWDTYQHYKGVVLVASAGNNSTRRPFWPAAFPQVVGVGAVAANGRARAYFSDYGPWVDVYAPGEDLVNAYAHGTYICREPPHIGQVRHFHGMARWSGTSFSAPLVAGLIAARISRTGEDGRQAADALLAQARAQRLPGVGPVLWPCDTGGCGCRSCGCGPACDCGQSGGGRQSCGPACGCHG